MRTKSDLPEKPCLQCGRPMTWRKRWARDWENVRYCSDRCRSDARRRMPATTPPSAGDR